jgi:hypothetical protein
MIAGVCQTCCRFEAEAEARDGALRQHAEQRQFVLYLDTRELPGAIRLATGLLEDAVETYCQPGAAWADVPTY